MTRFYATLTNHPDRSTPVTKLASAAHTPQNAGNFYQSGLSPSGSLTVVFQTNQSLHNSATWPTGGYGYSSDIQEAGADVTWRVDLERYPAGIVTTIASGLSGTGIKTSTAQTFATVNNTGSAASDDLAAQFVSANSNMMDSQGWGVYLSDSDSWIENTNFSTVITQPVAQVSQVNTAQVHTRNKRKTLGQARR